MCKALDEMGTAEGFRGCPEQGYSWLRGKISEHDYISRGCNIFLKKFLFQMDLNAIVAIS